MELVEACPVPASVDWPLPAGRKMGGGGCQNTAAYAPHPHTQMMKLCRPVVYPSLPVLWSSWGQWSSNFVELVLGLHWLLCILAGRFRSTLLPSSSPSLTPVGSLLLKRDFNNNHFMMVRIEILIRNLLVLCQVLCISSLNNLRSWAPLPDVMDGKVRAQDHTARLADLGLKPKSSDPRAPPYIRDSQVSSDLIISKLGTTASKTSMWTEIKY